MSGKKPFLHRAAPPANLLLLAGFLVAAAVSRGLLVRGAALLLVPTLAFLSGERLGALFRRGRFLILFALFLFVVQALTVRRGALLLSLPRVTDVGLEAGAGMALRFLLIVASSLLFVLVTDPDRLGAWIGRLRIPYRYGAVLVLSLRFVPLFRKELRAVRDAQAVRGIDASFRSPRGVVRAVRYTFLPLLVAGFSRADALALSMVGRAFGLCPRRTRRRAPPLGWRDAAAGAVALGVIGASVISCFLRWP